MYEYEVAVISLTLLGVLVFLLALTCCLRSNLVEVRCYGKAKMMHMQAMSYTRNEVSCNKILFSVLIFEDCPVRKYHPTNQFNII